MKKCKQGYYYCYTDEKCKPIPQGLKMTARFSGGGKEPEETGIDVPTNGNNQNGNGNGNGGSNGGSNGGGVSESIISEKRDGKSAKDKGYSLRDWFKGGGWKQTGGKYDGKPCAKQPGQTTKPYCRDADDRAAMSKDERNKAAAKKRKEDPNPDRKGKAKMVTQNNSFEPEANVVEEEMELLEYSGLVRAGIKVAGKRGGRAVQGGLKSGKTATKNAIQKKKAGRGERVGKVIGGVVGGIAGGAAGAGVASIGTGIAGGEVGERIGGAIGRKFDKKKKEEVTEAKDKKGKGSGTKDACYHKVKSRYSVWPSAYASGALVKCRKVGAANWGNSTKKESYELSNWRDDFKATEYEFIDLIKPEPLNGETLEEKKAQKCWPGYEKKGTKKMFGKTYNNCVKKEETEIEEKKDPCWDTHKQVGMKKKGGKMVPNCVPKEEKQIGGGNLKKLAGKATKRVDADVDGDVDTKDMSSSETGEFVPSPCGKKKLKPKVRFEQSDWRSDLGEDWQKVNKSDKTDGMSQKAVNAYRRENPGSKLKTAVTGNPKKGSKDAKRRSSYCSRSEGQKDMHNIDCTKTPDKAICKARRRWKC